MEENFVTFEQAKKFKELNYGKSNKHAYGYYYTIDGQNWKFASESKFDYLNEQMDIGPNFYIVVPLKQQAFKWFEEEHAMFVDCQTDTTINEVLGHAMKIKSWKFPPIIVGNWIDKQEAELACVEKLIKIVEQNKK